MAGFGSLLAKGLLGAAEGYGNYLTNEGLRRQKQADDDALLMREQALAKFRSNLAVEQEKALLPSKKELVSHTATENRLSNTLELDERAKMSAAAAQAEEARKIREEQRDFETWKKKNSITLSTDKAKAAYQASLDVQKSLKTGGYKVMGSTIDAETGTEVYTLQDASGNISTYDSGVVVQKPVTRVGQFGETITEVPKPSKTGVVPGFRGGSETRSTSKDGRQTISSQEYLRMVSDAQKRAQRGDPEWKGLDSAGIRKKLEDLARARGLDLPPIQ